MSHSICFASALVALSGFSFGILTPKTYGDWETASSNPFAKTYAVQVHNSEAGESGDCSQTVAIAGHGLFDELLLSCDTKIDLIRANDNEVVIGDRYFSNTPSSLMVVNEDLICTERTYDISGENVYVDENEMASEECHKVRKKIKTELTNIAEELGDEAVRKTVSSNVEKIFSDSEDSNTENIPIIKENEIDSASKNVNHKITTPTSYNITDEENDIESKPKGYVVEISQPFFNNNGILVKKVTIKSSSYKDIIEIPSSAKSYVIKSDNKMLVGETLFSDNPNQLVIATGPSSCSLREYGADGSIKIRRLSIQRCLMVHQKMREMTNRTLEDSDAAKVELGNQLVNLGHQMSNQFGSLISGILDAGTSVASSGLDLAISPLNRPPSTGRFYQNRQNNGQHNNEQHLQELKYHMQSGQQQNIRQAEEPSEILTPLLSNVARPFFNMFNNIGAPSTGNGVPQVGNSANTQSNRQTSYVSQLGAESQQGQLDLFGMLNPLTWIN